MKKKKKKERLRVKEMKKSLKKVVVVAMTAVTMASMFTGCSKDEDKKSITVVSREDGSGTRGAFVELTGIQEDEKDRTTSSAEITNSTSVMMTTVSGDENAIGYISLGSLNDSVKAVKVDGVEPTVENIKAGKYSVARPFNVATKDGLSEVAQDFINYILSDDGQKIIEDEGYISDMTGTTYEASNLSGTVTLAGSTSVAPVMEVLTEKYKALNPDVKFEIQQTGSSAGITSAIEGACDIGMSSRALKDTELAEGLTETKIATDGIAVIVNKDNEINDISKENIVKIYTGEVTNWDDVK